MALGESWTNLPDGARWGEAAIPAFLMGGAGRNSFSERSALISI